MKTSPTTPHDPDDDALSAAGPRPNRHTGLAAYTTTARTPEINGISAEFVDHTVEREFQRAIAEERVRQFRIVGLPAAVFFILGTFIDVMVIGVESTMTGAIVLSRFAVAAVILASVVIADRRKLSGEALDRLILIPLALVSLVICAVVWAIRGELLLHALTALVLTLVYYVFVPIRLTVATCASLVFGGTFIAVAAVFLDLRPEEFIQVVLYITLINVLGAVVARDRHIAARREYAVRQIEVRATEELRREMASRTAAESALAESEARFRSLVELSPDAIVVHRNGKILYINPFGLRLVGAASTADLENHSVYDFLLPAFREIALERTRNLQEHGAPQSAVEFVFRRLDGNEVACEVVSGPVLFEGTPAIQSVIRDITERRRMREELTRLATTDPLTGICNRRRFFSRLEKEWSRARRHARPLSILMFDLDFFKKINDTHGHAIGDAMLCAIVDAATSLLRGEDVFARIGGEEFAILLPEIALEGAASVAERLRKQLAEVEVSAPDGTVGCTVSIGVAQGRLAQESPEAGLKRADDALYEAKRTGRNRVCVG